MIKTGLWIELEAIIGFIVGLGLGSLLGQRTVAVILMIVLEIVLTPILSRARIPHLINLQRAVVGLAMAHLEPGGLGSVFGGGGGPGGGQGTPRLVPESTTVAVCVDLRLARGLDRPRRVADDDQGRLRATSPAHEDLSGPERVDRPREITWLPYVQPPMMAAGRVCQNLGGSLILPPNPRVGVGGRRRHDVVGT